MCLDRGAYVEARVYDRLIGHGVVPARARGVAKKVRARYDAKRFAELGERGAILQDPPAEPRTPYTGRRDLSGCRTTRHGMDGGSTSRSHLNAR